MKAKSLSLYLSDIPKEDKDKPVYVYIPFYKRKFKVVAVQKLDKEVDENEPVAIIVNHAPDA